MPITHHEVPTHLNVEDKLRPVSGHHADGFDFAVGDDVSRALQISQNCGPQAEILHNAGAVPDLNDVTDAELTFQNNKSSADDVFNEALRAEANSHTDYTGACENRADFEAQLAEYHQSSHNENGNSEDR